MSVASSEGDDIRDLMEAGRQSLEEFEAELQHMAVQPLRQSLHLDPSSDETMEVTTESLESRETELRYQMAMVYRQELVTEHQRSESEKWNRMLEARAESQQIFHEQQEHEESIIAEKRARIEQDRQILEGVKGQYHDMVRKHEEAEQARIEARESAERQLQQLEVLALKRAKAEQQEAEEVAVVKDKLMTHELYMQNELESMKEALAAAQFYHDRVWAESNVEESSSAPQHHEEFRVRRSSSASQHREEHAEFRASQHAASSDKGSVRTLS
jgi:hypothetical protein